MPAYYDVSFPIATHGTTATESTGPHLTLRTGTGVRARVQGVYAAARHSSAGGGFARLKTLSTATSSSGTTFTPNKRNPVSPAATTSALTSQTGPGSTPAQRFQVGFAQTGGQGGWVALEPDAAITLSAGGSANGNADIYSIAVGTSVPADLSVEFAED